MRFFGAGFFVAGATGAVEAPGAEATGAELACTVSWLPVWLGRVPPAPLAGAMDGPCGTDVAAFVEGRLEELAVGCRVPKNGPEPIAIWEPCCSTVIGGRS